MKPFIPTDNPREFRNALGRFATGVTIVSALEEGVPIGMTANSFTSLSLSPPLILWSPAKNSTRHDAFVAADNFNVHILSSDQENIATAFSRSKHGYDGLDTALNIAGVPIIADCLSVFECEKYAHHDAGDHTIVVGRVVRAHYETGVPLVYLDGQFARI